MTTKTTRRRQALPGERNGRPQLTPGGRDRLAERVADIRAHKLPGLRPALTDRERDERDVAEFERLLETTLVLEALLAEAEVIEDDPARFDGTVDLGMRVKVVLADGSTVWVRPVHPVEASLDDERISVTSPLATAVMGARAGGMVWVDAPTGVWACKVIEIDPSVVDDGFAVMLVASAH